MTNGTISASAVTIFHNPVCSNSRGALAILEERSIDHVVVEYLNAPPSEDVLGEIADRLVDPITDLIRRSDKKFVERGYDPAQYQTREEVIAFLLENPDLMQRPIIVRGDRAVIARPSIRIDEVL